MRRYSRSRAFADLDPITLICCLIFVAILGAFLFCMGDNATGKPLTQTMTVNGHRFEEGHWSYASKYATWVPASWHLKVTNTVASGEVEVGENLYNQVQDGDPVTVTGVEGGWSHSWYLNEARACPK